MKVRARHLWPSPFEPRRRSRHRRIAMLVGLIVLVIASGCHRYAHTEGWLELQTRNVRIRTNLPQVYAEPFAERYQRARDAIAAKEFQCAFDHLVEPIDVILIAGVYGEAFVGPDFSGFYVRPEEPLVALPPSIVIKPADEDRESYLFLHELTHRLVDECVPRAPTWLDEGLATFYETARLEGEKLRVGYPSGVFIEGEGNAGQPSYGAAVERIPLHEAPTFPELRQQDDAEFYEGNANYHAAWVAVHLMKLDPDLEARFDRYVNGLARGQDDVDAWRRSFGNTDVDDRYRKHLTAEYEVMSYPVSVRDSPVERVDSLDSSNVALMLSTFIEWGDRRGARVARGYMEYARGADPDATAPLLYLASLHATREKWRRAQKPLDAAVQLDPTNPDVLSAALQLDTLRHRRRERSTLDRQMLESWAEALEGAAQSSFHHVALSNWFLSREEPDAALFHADRAIALDPRNASAEVAAADAAVALGRLDLARAHLEAALGLTENTAREKREALEDRLDDLGP